MNGLGQGTASVVPEKSENSGVLTPEVGAILDQGFYEIRSSEKRRDPREERALLR